MTESEFIDYITLTFLLHLAKELKIDINEELEPLRNYNGSNKYLLDLKERYF